MGRSPASRQAGEQWRWARWQFFTVLLSLLSLLLDACAHASLTSWSYPVKASSCSHDTPHGDGVGTCVHLALARRVWGYLRRSAQEAERHHDAAASQDTTTTTSTTSRVMGLDAAEAAEAWTRHHSQRDHLQQLVPGEPDDAATTVSQSAQPTATHAPLALPELAAHLLRGMLLRHEQAPAAQTTTTGLQQAVVEPEDPLEQEQQEEEGEDDREDGAAFWTVPDPSQAELGAHVDPAEQQHLQLTFFPELQSHDKGLGAFYHQRAQQQQLAAATRSRLQRLGGDEDEEEEEEGDVGGGAAEWELEAAAARDAALLGPLAVLRGLVSHLFGEGAVELPVEEQARAGGVGGGGGHPRASNLVLQAANARERGAAFDDEQQPRHQHPRQGVASARDYYWGSLDLGEEERQVPWWVDDAYVDDNYYVEAAAAAAATEEEQQGWDIKRERAQALPAYDNNDGAPHHRDNAWAAVQRLMAQQQEAEGDGLKVGGPEQQRQREEDEAASLMLMAVLASAAQHHAADADEHERQQQLVDAMVEQRLTWEQWVRAQGLQLGGSEQQQQQQQEGGKEEDDRAVPAWMVGLLLEEDGSANLGALLLLALLLATGCMLVGFARSLDALRGAMALLAAAASAAKGARFTKGASWGGLVRGVGAQVWGARPLVAGPAPVGGAGSGAHPLLVPFVLEAADGSQLAPMRGYMLLSEEDLLEASRHNRSLTGGAEEGLKEGYQPPKVV